tara:strand:+ start:55 stop:441 length:387 start_codon:yes stop_codon:yes gene_type:complete
MIKIQSNRIIKFLLIILIFFQLIYVANKRLSFKKEIILNSFKKNYGSEYIITQDILELNEISKNLKLNEINISKKLYDNVFFYQRSVEFLYPIKVTDKAKVTFYLIDESIEKNCEIIKSFKYLKAIKC